jgi:hypothetical protein
VWIEIELQKALASGDAAAIKRLAEPVPGLDWTKDGMNAFLRGARFHYLAGAAADRGGDKALALEHWRKAAAEWNSPQVFYAREAARRRPDYDDAEWQTRVARRLVALETADADNDSPSIDVWRGIILRSLGRDADAREAFRDALLAPDRGLSRYLARTGLQSGKTPSQ